MRIIQLYGERHPSRKVDHATTECAWLHASGDADRDGMTLYPHEYRRPSLNSDQIEYMKQMQVGEAIVKDPYNPLPYPVKIIPIIGRT